MAASERMRRYERLCDEVVAALEAGATVKSLRNQLNAIRLQHKLIPRQERNNVRLDPQELQDTLEAIERDQARDAGAGSLCYFGSVHPNDPRNH